MPNTILVQNFSGAIRIIEGVGRLGQKFKLVPLNEKIDLSKYQKGDEFSNLWTFYHLK